MIPRFKPDLGKHELLAALKPGSRAVEHFENEFARAFEAKHALAFPYGRSALWGLFNALEIRDAEIIIPAYTCSVVAHAVVLSGNKPRFVDVSLHDYNMDLDLLADAITERTRAIVPTHLFGCPLDVERLRDIVQTAENRYGNKIWIIQDCAHAFGARWKGRLVCNEGDAAIFGLNISKLITSIFGGMMTTDSCELAEKVRQWRGAHFRRPPAHKAWRRRLYLCTVYAVFHDRPYGLIQWMERKTPLLDSLTKAYHLDGKIHFPPGHDEEMTTVEAGVGRVQLGKYAEIIERRRENANYYFQALAGVKGLVLPPSVEGSTYSHFTIRGPDKDTILKLFRRKGIELGELIQYSLPHMSPYRKDAPDPTQFPNSLYCSSSVVNLPIYRRLSPTLLAELIRTARRQEGTE